MTTKSATVCPAFAYARITRANTKLTPKFIARITAIADGRRLDRNDRCAEERPRQRLNSLADISTYLINIIWLENNRTRRQSRHASNDRDSRSTVDRTFIQRNRIQAIITTVYKVSTWRFGRIRIYGIQQHAFTSVHTYARRHVHKLARKTRNSPRASGHPV